MKPENEFLEIFESANANSVNAEGITLPYCVYEKDDGFALCAMAVGPVDTYRHVARMLIKERPDRLIFGMDRFVLPGQGIETKDCLSVSFWNGACWRFGVIPYTAEPSRFGPILWDHFYWTEALRREMSSAWQHISAAPHRTPSPAMALPILLSPTSAAACPSQRSF